MDNASVIRKGFARLQSGKDAACRACLKDAMERAMAYALASHDSGHRLHEILGDNYGWAVFHAGTMTDYGIHSGKGGESSTLPALRGYSSKSGEGWCGVLYAGMTAEAPSYYSISYEKAIVTQTVQFTRDNFGKYFTAA